MIITDNTLINILKSYYDLMIICKYSKLLDLRVNLVSVKCKTNLWNQEVFVLAADFDLVLKLLLV